MRRFVLIHLPSNFWKGLLWTAEPILNYEGNVQHCGSSVSCYTQAIHAWHVAKTRFVHVILLSTKVLNSTLHLVNVNNWILKICFPRKITCENFCNAMDWSSAKILPRIKYLLYDNWLERFLQPIIAEETFFNQNRQQISTPEAQLEWLHKQYFKIFER